MVIYDKNQFTFNLVLTGILIILIFINVTYYKGFMDLNIKLEKISQNLTIIENNQDFNFLQGPHYTLESQLTTKGFYVSTADDSGLFNGPSMQPAIFDGNTLVEKKYDKKGQLTAGQIVRFIREDGSAVIHRVRADYGDTVYVQGDSLKQGEIIKKEQITHLVVGVVFT